tara:strand:+ start:187 stop:924 length:738 start_codon:yes stop_codon:yes gene_type:complete
MTQSNLSFLKKAPEEMPFKELISQRENLTKTIPLLDEESKEIVKADLAAITEECSPRWDELYVTRENLKTIIKTLKEEKAEVDKSIKSKTNDLDSLNVLLREIRRSFPPHSDCDTFSGKYFQFKVKAITPGQQYSLKIIQTKKIEEFSHKDQVKFFYKEERIETIETVVTSIEGEEISRTSLPKSTEQFILNENAVISAYKDGSLPHGIKVIQNYRITTKRISGNMDVETSQYTKRFLREPTSSS